MVHGNLRGSSWMFMKSNVIFHSHLNSQLNVMLMKLTWVYNKNEIEIAKVIEKYVSLGVGNYVGLHLKVVAKACHKLKTKKWQMCCPWKTLSMAINFQWVN